MRTSRYLAAALPFVLLATLMAAIIVPAWARNANASATQNLPASIPTLPTIEVRATPIPMNTPTVTIHDSTDLVLLESTAQRMTANAHTNLRMPYFSFAKLVPAKDEI